MRTRRWAGAVILAAALPVALPTPGAAVAPVRVAWWSEVAVAGTALPAPTTDPGGLQVAQGATGPTSFGALHYEISGGIGGGIAAPMTLTLDITPNSTLGTPAVGACRTTVESWPAGGDQPASAAPGYDCTGGVAGTVSADGTSVSFALPPGLRDARGDLDVAIVPVPGSVPFQTSFAAPGASSLTLPVAASAEAIPPAATSAPTGGVTQPSRPAPAPPRPVAAPVPVPGAALTPPSPPPALLVPAPAPVVAPASPAAEAAVSAVRAATARASPDHSRKVALALLFLVVDLVIVAAMQPARAPRLLGGIGRGRPAPEPPSPVGGLGRYARPRLTPPRRIS